MKRAIPRTARLINLLIVLLLLGGCASKPKAALEPGVFLSMIEDLAAPEMQGRDAGSEGIDRARDYLVDHFKRSGLEPAFVIDGRPSYTQPFELRIGRDDDGEPIMATVENVGGLLPGSGDLADEVVVVGGHYDHVGFGEVGSRAKDRRGELHPGADDNASGTAGVVLLARHFAQMRTSPQTPRRTILFTGFAGEERGLHGSRYMTGHPDEWAFDADKVVGMINMDMVGRLREGELYVFADASGQQWRQWTQEANKAVGLNLKWDVRPPGGSDHSLFIAACIPAVFFNTWLHPDYHTPDDTPDKINAEGGVQVLTLVAGLLDRVSAAPERVVFVKPPPRQPRPYLGVRMEAGEGEAGVVLEEVPNGPMKRAGAEPGDVLVALGDKAVKSPGDVRSFLSEAKPGDEVVVWVNRGGVKVELKVKLGSR